MDAVSVALRAPVVVLSLALLQAGLCAQDEAATWLDEHAVRINTLDLDAPFDDLQPLKETLKDARIVQLGEQSHGDGTTFRAKARLIRFLHEEMGFDVLAFECGLYECAKGNELIGPRADPMDAMRAGIFSRPWHTRSVHEVFRYMCACAGTDRPMTLAGFDPQSTGQAFGRLMEDLLAFVAADVDPGDDAETLRRLHAIVLTQGPIEDQDAWEAGLEALGRLEHASRLRQARLAAIHGSRRALLYGRVLENYRGRTRLRELRGMPGDSPEDRDLTREYGRLRDEWMGRNLIWLADTYYPDSKIICWAATYHLANDLEGAVVSGHDYTGTHPMGEYVKQRFGDEVYTIGFCAYEGSWGQYGRPARPIPRPAQDGIETIFHQVGCELAFVDLRQEGPFSGEFSAAPLGYASMRARWADVVDGLFFTNTMTPSVAVGEPWPDIAKLQAEYASRPTPVAASNRTGAIPNGDFEQGAGDSPTGWRIMLPPPEGASLTWDRSAGHSGTSSLRIQSNDPGITKTLAWSHSVHAASPGKYRLSAMIKTRDLSAAAKAAVCINAVGAERGAGGPLAFATTPQGAGLYAGTRHWVPIQADIAAPEGTTGFSVFAFMAGGTGAVWFDDIQLERVGDVPAALPAFGEIINGDFEQGTDGQPLGWTTGLKPSEACSLTWDRSTGHSGSASLRIDNADADARTAVAWRHAVHSVTPGRYRLSAMIRTQDLSPTAVAGVTINAYSVLGSREGWLTSATTPQDPGLHADKQDWSLIETEITAPEKTRAFVVFALLSKGTGTVWFDDIKLERLDR